MSLRTAAGTAQVRHLSAAFGLSRAALYKAACAPERPPVRPRRPPPATVMSNEALLARITELTGAYPAWGHRKVWAMLRRERIFVARRRVWALMHRAGLTFLPAARRCEPRRGTVVAATSNRRWSTDMTTAWTRNDGWVALTPVIDNGDRWVFKVGVSKAQDAPAILQPLEEALRQTFVLPESVPDGLELRTDHGAVYTGGDCEDLCDARRVQQTFSPVGRPTGNAVAERIIQTMKLELIWLRDWEDLAELERETARWVEFYNTQRPHEALGWQTPLERRTENLKENRTLPEAA